jgi:hypothetical protein
MRALLCVLYVLGLAEHLFREAEAGDAVALIQEFRYVHSGFRAAQQDFARDSEDGDDTAAAQQQAPTAAEHEDITKTVPPFHWKGKTRLDAEESESAEVDCTAEPYLCQSPFNCNAEKSSEELERTQIATIGGHADWSAWCGSPYSSAANECYRGNLTGYAALMARAQVEASDGEHSLADMDAHYCFSFGHCDNTEVIADTTLNESEAMCDRRFGHDKWTNLTFDEAMNNLAFWPEGDMHLDLDLSMHLGPKAEFAFATMMCAMGSYHCDVMYCRQEYCSDPEFAKKFGKYRLIPPSMTTTNATTSGTNSSEPEPAFGQ